MKLNLTDTQLKKIELAHKKNNPVTIQLTNEQINKGKNYILTDIQVEKLRKAKKENKGMRLVLNHKDIKEGGFLPLVIAGIGAAAALADAYNNNKNKKTRKNN